jgi:hypothetical protein
VVRDLWIHSVNSTHSSAAEVVIINKPSAAAQSSVVDVNATVLPSSKPVLWSSETPAWLRAKRAAFSPRQHVFQ